MISGKKLVGQSKNILLTGGLGYIGSHTAAVLARSGYDIVLYDNLSNSKRSVINQLETVVGKRCAFIEGDVCDTLTLEAVLRTHHVDGVIHFAGFKAVGESVKNPIKYYHNNVNGTLSLLQAMLAANIRTLVFSSSATVYGEPQYLPLDEKHPTNPQSPYGRSKLQIEEILLDVAQSDASWSIACLRYFNPVGAHESGLLGEESNDIPNNLMPYIVQVASGERPHLNVFGNDYSTEDGTGVRDYIHVVDLAEGHQAALEFLSKKNGWHAINLGTGNGYSVLEMIKHFESSTSQCIPYRFAPRRAGDIAMYYANTEKASQLLAWQAKQGLDDMCFSTWNFQSKTLNEPFMKVEE